MNAHSIATRIHDYFEAHHNPMVRARFALEGAGVEDFAAHLIAEAIAYGLKLPVDDIDFTLQHLFKSAVVAEQATVAFLGLD